VLQFWIFYFSIQFSLHFYYPIRLILRICKLKSIPLILSISYSRFRLYSV
jgi:hypothetical protein